MPASRGPRSSLPKVNSNILVEISGDVKPKKVAKKRNEDYCQKESK